MKQDECWVTRYQEVIDFTNKELFFHFFVLSRFICTYSIYLSAFA